MVISKQETSHASTWNIQHALFLCTFSYIHGIQDTNPKNMLNMAKLCPLHRQLSQVSTMPFVLPVIVIIVVVVVVVLVAVFLFIL